MPLGGRKRGNKASPRSIALQLDLPPPPLPQRAEASALLPTVPARVSEPEPVPEPQPQPQPQPVPEPQRSGERSPVRPCSRFQLDITSAEFGVCKCGFKQDEHSETLSEPALLPNRQGDVVVVFDEPPPLGIRWHVNKLEGELAIEKIRPGTAAASKPELEVGLMLTHIGDVNVEDVALKWPDVPLADAVKQVTNMLRDAARPVTLTLKRPLPEPEPEPEPDGERAALIDVVVDTAQEPEPEPEPEAKAGRMSRLVNWAEKKTGLDLDRDGDVGIVGVAEPEPEPEPVRRTKSWRQKRPLIEEFYASQETLPAQASAGEHAAMTPQQASPAQLLHRRRAEFNESRELRHATAFVKEVAIFQDVAARHEQFCKDVAARLVETSYQNGAHILQKGDHADALFFVVSGSVEIYARLHSGKEGVNVMKPLATLHAGDLMGEVELLADPPLPFQNYGVAAGTPEEDVGGDGSRRRFTTAEFFSLGFRAPTTTETVVRSLSKDDLFELISLHPVAGKQVLDGLCRLSEQRSEHTRFHEHTAFWTFPMNAEPETFPPSHPYAFAVEGKVAEGGRFKGRVPPKFNFVQEWLPAVLAPSLGVLPFFIPMAINSRICGGPGPVDSSGSSASWAAEALGVLSVCADVHRLTFVFCTALWWLGTVFFLFELMRVDFGRLGFGKPWHYAFTSIGSGATYALLEYTTFTERTKECARAPTGVGFGAERLELDVAIMSCTMAEMWWPAIAKILLAGWPCFALIFYFFSKPFFFKAEALKREGIKKAEAQLKRAHELYRETSIESLKEKAEAGLARMSSKARGGHHHASSDAEPTAAAAVAEGERDDAMEKDEEAGTQGADDGGEGGADEQSSALGEKMLLELYNVALADSYELPPTADATHNEEAEIEKKRDARRQKLAAAEAALGAPIIDGDAAKRPRRARKKSWVQRVLGSKTSAEKTGKQEQEPEEASESEEKTKDKLRPAALRVMQAEMADIVVAARQETEAVVEEQQHKHRQERLAERAARWRKVSTDSKIAREAMTWAAAWLVVGIVAILTNWSWLQLFIAIYNSEPPTATRNLVLSVVFIASEAILKALLAWIFGKSEANRLGLTGNNKTTFDRYQLVNLLALACYTYTNVYRQSLFIQQTDFGKFVALALPNIVLKAGWYALQVTDWWKVAQKYEVLTSVERSGTGDAAACKRRMVSWLIWLLNSGKTEINPDNTNKQGQVCFNSFLQFTTVVISSVQYLCFLTLLKLFPANLPLFPKYHDVINGTASAAELGADQDEMEGLFGQQFLFVGLVLALEFFVYETTNQVSRRYVQKMTPHYIGCCHLREYPRFRWSIILICAHIVSDVYLGILFTVPIDGGANSWSEFVE